MTNSTNTMNISESPGQVIHARMICYTMTPDQFILDIPVAALATLTPSDRARIHAFLDDWIDRNTPARSATP